MSKKRRNRHKTEHKEAQFDFDDAKELTVGEAMRKNEEVESRCVAWRFYLGQVCETT